MELFQEEFKSKGAICKSSLEYVLISDVIEFPEHSEGRLLGSIVLAENKEWISIPFVKNTLNSGESNVNGGGKFLNQVLSGQINLPNATRRTAILNLEDTDLICRYKDLNGDTYIVGSVQHPALLNVISRNRGATPGTGFKLNVTITTASKHPYLAADA
ncbi:MAG: hypothetical protein ACRBFS_22880 [Aureispira sp.]